MIVTNERLKEVRSMLRRLILGLCAVSILGAAGFLALAWRDPIAPRDPSQPLNFPAAQVAHGAMLASAGFCADCHSAKNGEAFAGGYGLNTGFGTIYSTNITPDPDTGIGRWTLAAFKRAMRHGVSREGSHLFPAFPYTHFTKLTDGDVAALYAYFMTRPAVQAETNPNTLPFPLNIRLLQEGWKLLFFRPGRFQPDPAQPADWNRGAYLAEALSHCGACHTPRNVLGAEKRAVAFAGAEVEVEFLPSTEKPTGLGEPATTVVAPAIGNAIFRAVGVRLRHLPIRAADVHTSLKSA